MMRLPTLALAFALVVFVNGSPANAQDKDENTLTFPERAIPAGARIYVAPMNNGFETYVIAGFQEKKVPLTVVTIRDRADFEMTGVSETDKAGWAKMLFLKSSSSAETASIKIVNLKTGDVVFGYSVNKGNSARGKQSAGEAVAKHLKEKVDSRQ
jgi:hypothetical protein